MDAVREKPLTIHSFAKLAGVTVRALHHYDRLGLLKPERTATGYRVYREADLERLEQIAALKFIGVPLRRIQHLLESGKSQLRETLCSQLSALREKRRLLDLVIEAVQEAESRLQGGQGEPASLKRIIEMIDMQNNSDWITKYFDPQVRANVEHRKATWTPEGQRRLEQNWSALIRDAEPLLDQDPAGPEAQALALRCETFIRDLTGGDPGLIHGVKAMYADRSNWPERLTEQFPGFAGERVLEFLRKALVAHGSRNVRRG